MNTRIELWHQEIDTAPGPRIENQRLRIDFRSKLICNCRKRVKACFDIALDDPGVAVVSHLLATGHGLVRVPVGTKPVGTVMEFNLEDGLQRHAYRLLDDLVAQTGDDPI